MLLLKAAECASARSRPSRATASGGAGVTRLLRLRAAACIVLFWDLLYLR